MNRSRAITVLVAVVASSLSGCSESPTLVVSGSVVGHDGAPMPLAHVHLLRPLDLMLDNHPLVSAEAAADGRFEIATADSGVFYLVFTGVDHERKQVPLIVEGPVELALDVRLATPEYVDDLSGVKVIGEFNDFEVASARDMRERPDGSFVLEIEADADSLAYQLTGILQSGHRSSGTESDSYVADTHGDYRSVLRAEGGKVTITFDPTRLPRSDQPASVVFSDPGSTQARLASLTEELEGHIADWAEAYEEAAQTGEPLSYDWTSTVEELGLRAEGEEDLLIRQALAYITILLTSYGAELDSATAGWSFDELPPTSHLWSVQPFAIPMVAAAAFNSLEGEGESSGEGEGAHPAWLDGYVAYMDAGAATHPDGDVRATMLMAVVWLARQAEDENLGREYYGRLLADYPDSPAADWAREYAPDRNIQVGKMIPEFSFASLDDPTVSISRESLLGTVYLMDFWATWCVPCIAELPNLDELYEKYGGQGFQIVSFSFDEQLDAVIEFREEHRAMPWLHVHIPDAWDDEAMHPFEVFAIPKAILVGADGMIIGTDEDVRGEKLQETLARVLGEGPVQGATY